MSYLLYVLPGILLGWFMPEIIAYFRAHPHRFFQLCFLGLYLAIMYRVIVSA
jgi:hypothetical protein